MLTTENYYEEHKDLTIEELEVLQNKIENELTHVYHMMSMATLENNKEKFQELNNKSIELHRKLSAVQILINHKETGLI